MIVYVTNLDSIELYPDNTSTDFRVELPHPLDGNHNCGLVHCTLSSQPANPLFIVGNFVESSILGGRYQSILGHASAKTNNYPYIAYSKVKTVGSSTLHFKLVNRLGITARLQGSLTILKLEFKHV